MVDPEFRKIIIYCVYLSAYMWIFFLYFTFQILEYKKDAPDPSTSILLYDKEKQSSFYLTDEPARALQRKAPVIKKLLSRNKELLPLIIMNLVKSQGVDFGIEMLKEEYSEIGEENGDIVESGDIMWFSNIQMQGNEEGISTPTVMVYSNEVKCLDSIAQQKKKRILNFLSTDMMINDCVCSKTNKYKCKCFGNHKV